MRADLKAIFVGFAALWLAEVRILVLLDVIEKMGALSTAKAVNLCYFTAPQTKLRPSSSIDAVETR